MDYADLHRRKESKSLGVRRCGVVLHLPLLLVTADLFVIRQSQPSFSGRSAGSQGGGPVFSIPAVGTPGADDDK